MGVRHTVRRETRRAFLARAAGATAALWMAGGDQVSAAGATYGRRFHISASAHALETYPDLPEVARAAGITDVWLAGFLYGTWYRRPDALRELVAIWERHGVRTHAINVPLGHPGPALGISDGSVPITPPGSWRNARGVDGNWFSGTSVHDPAPAENAQAARELQDAGFRELFLDDDFRIAQSPGTIGGCFCDDCRDEFLRLAGYPASAFEDLCQAVRERRPTPLLRQWVEFWCDKLWATIRGMQAAAPRMQIGPMVMYLGSEKAGIALDRYRRVPFRVGELMFSDPEFTPVKGKTDELFSCLFHRRFASPELAYSETTAYPEDQLSAANMAAKLTISLIADVRNTMYMSGLMPFPIEHWAVLGPAMKESARLHDLIAGHRPRGPFKHFWGWDSRLVGNDQPYSLFLATGVPFEVVDDLPDDGWAFLSDADARAVAEGRVAPRSRHLIARPHAANGEPPLTAVPEDLAALFALKARIVPSLRGVPYVEGEVPTAFAWYPTARRGIIWNLTEASQGLRVIRDGRVVFETRLEPLGVTATERL